MGDKNPNKPKKQKKVVQKTSPELSAVPELDTAKKPKKLK